MWKGKKLSKTQKKSRVYLLKRLGWYAFGFLLFYAPFALFNRGLAYLMGSMRSGDIHATCLRMPIVDVFNGKWATLLTVSGVSLILLIVTAFIMGPFFCGRLCATGAFTEYLSRLVPDKLKIDWAKYVNPVPIRYGFFAAFIIGPIINFSLSCSYCGFSFFEKFVNGGIWGDFGVLGSTAIITAILWLVVFGIFTKGGRGYCNFMCPVGAAQNLVHSLSAKLPFTYKIKYDRNKCVSCSNCVKDCPMGALTKGEDKKIQHSNHNCITCHQCVAVCPTKAITFGRGEGGWKVKEVQPEVKPVVEKGA